MKNIDTIIRAKVRKSFAQKSGRIFAQLGISTDDAINLFLGQVIQKKGLPFTVALGGVGDDGTFWSEKIRQDSQAELYGR